MAADFYQTLGVARGASSQELKSAYRNLAKKHHPDKNSNDKKAEAKFKEISRAYDVLSDDQQRAAYDRFGHQAFEAGMNGGAGGGGGFDPNSFGGDFGNFSDAMGGVFSDLFGGDGGRGRGTEHNFQGENLRYDLEIALEEAAIGTNKEFSFTADETCNDCSGKGAAKSSKTISCAQCGGRGTIHQQSGFFALQRTCNACGGEGSIMSNPCTSCSGQGRVRNKKTLRLKIPAGIDEGAQMRLAGKGAAGIRSGVAGDLFVFIHIKPHKIFEREGSDLYCSVPISIVNATLGGEVEVPLLKGESASIKIPEGSQWGKRLRMRGFGLTSLRSSRTGDLFIDLEVEVPINLDTPQKKLLQKFNDSLAKKNSPHSQGFIDKIQGFFDKFK